MGANTTLPAAQGDVVIRHEAGGGVDVNLTAFLLTGAGKVRSDADMVFFNAPEGEGGSATYRAPAQAGGKTEHRLSFDLTKVPAGVEKIVVALTEDKGAGFAQVRGLSAHVEAGGQTVELTPVPDFPTEKGLMVAEVYVRGGAHKVRAVWQGFASGLAGLATAHGVEIDDAPPPPAAEPKVSFQKVTGAVNLKKGDKPVMMEKTPLITASVTWRSGTDYDVYALVMTRDGTQVDVATFGAKDTPAQMEYGGAVKHLGDVKRGAGEQVEIVEIRLNPDILAVVPVAYSAQSNGTGSFSKYNVSLQIDNHSGTSIGVSAENANDNDKVYTCVPGVILNTPDGVVIEPLERYSAPGSEFRPKLVMERDGVRVVMDRGPKNDFK